MADTNGNGTGKVVAEVAVAEVDVLEAAIVEETPTEEVTAEAIDEIEPKATEVDATEEVAAVVPEPIVFDVAEELLAILAKADEVLTRYDLTESPELESLITTLRAKAESAPVDIIGEYSAYGSTDEVKELLDQHATITSRRMTEQGQRPNTDKFVEGLVAKSTLENDTAGWMFHDLAKVPSLKYPGINKFEEFIADALALPTDKTVTSVIGRYNQFIGHMKAGQLPADDVPSFIPDDLREAYNLQSRQARDRIAALDPTFEDDAPTIQAELADLKRAQDGIIASAEKQQIVAEREYAQRQAFQNEVINKQITFVNGFRDAFTQDLIRDVKFSPEPKLNSILAHQHVSLLTQAFEVGPSGDFARKALTESGITFDNARAQQLLKEVETASVSLVSAQRAVDLQGNPLDPVAFRKAQQEFEKTGAKWQTFAKETLGQLSKLTSTGTAEAVKAEVAKIKVAPKARVTTNGGGAVPSKAKANPYAYGTVPYYEYQADEIIRAQEARKAQSYT